MAGRRGRGDARRVELLDADLGLVPWSDEPVPVAAPPPTGHRRLWIGLGVVGGLAAVILAANVIGGDGDQPRVAPSSTAAPATTRGMRTTPATTAALTAVTSESLDDTIPYLVADAPDGFAVVWASPL